MPQLQDDIDNFILQLNGAPTHWSATCEACVYNVCTVRTGIVIHKQKLGIQDAPKQTYMLFQNDIPIDVAFHRYTLNVLVSSGTKNNSSPNEPSATTVTVSFNGVLFLDGNGYLVLSILKSSENQTAN
ncbi:uncharacterized protein TNCV_4355701 [Trichonephila clavipes]|nr:uncharacterized protein TNCV_4355701 [Trichonephila clavipes]